jgi:hypothetical protein
MSKRFAVVANGVVDNIVIAENASDIRVDGLVIDMDGLESQPAIGYLYDGEKFAAPAQVEKPSNPTVRRISVGAFKDRLGMDALAIAVSNHPVCVALREMLYDRKWIDLDRPDAGRFLDMLIAAGEPAANPLFPGSGSMTTEKKAVILGAPVEDNERP